MSPIDLKKTLVLIEELWPRIDWPSDIRLEFARRIVNLPLDLERARAVLMDVRLAAPWKTCEPSDLLGPLEAAARPAERPEQSAAREDEARIVRAFKEADPAGFRALCEELHRAEPRTPARFRDTPSCYVDWPPSRAWLAEQIRRRGLAPVPPTVERSMGSSR